MLHVTLTCYFDGEQGFVQLELQKDIFIATRLWKNAWRSGALKPQFVLGKINMVLVARTFHYWQEGSWF